MWLSARRAERQGVKYQGASNPARPTAPKKGRMGRLKQRRGSGALQACFSYLSTQVSSNSIWRAPEYETADPVGVNIKHHQQRLRVLQQTLSDYMDHAAHQWRLRTVPEEKGQGNGDLTPLYETNKYSISISVMKNVPHAVVASYAVRSVAAIVMSRCWSFGVRTTRWHGNQQVQTSPLMARTIWRRRRRCVALSFLLASSFLRA